MGTVQMKKKNNRKILPVSQKLILPHKRQLNFCEVTLTGGISRKIYIHPDNSYNKNATS